MAEWQQTCFGCRRSHFSPGYLQGCQREFPMSENLENHCQAVIIILSKQDGVMDFQSLGTFLLIFLIHHIHKGSVKPQFEAVTSMPLCYMWKTCYMWKCYMWKTTTLFAQSCTMTLWCKTLFILNDASKAITLPYSM